MEELSNLCEVEYSQISRIETGKINTSISMAEVLAIALEVPVEELFKF
jgi:transcriptional regulator with XRE-family HTH domain